MATCSHHINQVCSTWCGNRYTQNDYCTLAHALKVNDHSSKIDSLASNPGSLLRSLGSETKATVDNLACPSRCRPFSQCPIDLL